MVAPAGPHSRIYTDTTPTTCPSTVNSLLLSWRDTIRRIVADPSSADPVTFTLLLAWAPSTIQTYLWGIDRMCHAATSHPNLLTWDDAVLHCCADIVLQGQSVSSIKTVLGACTFLFKMGLSPLAPPQTAWLFTRAAKRMCAPPAPRVWADPSGISELAHKASTARDFALVAVAVLSFALGLRASEAAGLRLCDLDGTLERTIRFRPAKPPRHPGV